MHPADAVPARDDRLSRLLAAIALALFIAVLALASPTPALAGTAAPHGVQGQAVSPDLHPAAFAGAAQDR